MTAAMPRPVVPFLLAMASTSMWLFLGISGPKPQGAVETGAGWDPAPLSHSSWAGHALPTEHVSPPAGSQHGPARGWPEPRQADVHLGKPPKVSCLGASCATAPPALREKCSVVQGSEGACVKYKKKSHSRSKTQARWSENWILPWGEELPGSSQHPQDKAGFNLSRYRNNVQDA